uniref:Lipopolysaccharide-binding protein n=1 Tax=Magallana gigas TaxID=29159 RepID=K1QRU3_MAGGI
MLNFIVKKIITTFVEPKLNAVNVALDVLSKGITHKGIPDQHGVSGNVSYDITRTTITRFKKPASTVTLQYVGPLWKTSNIDIGLHGDFQYKYKKGNFPIYEHGTFDMTGSGITFAIHLMIVAVPFASKFRIDYSFMSKPAFSYGFMETYHKGEVNWYGNRGSIPFDAPPLPAGSSSSKMLYLWLSDFLFNSMSYTAFSHGLWTYNITDKNIGKMFPNSQVMLNLKSSAMPNMTSVYGKTRVDADADIKFYATNGKEKFDYFLTLSAGFMLDFIVKNIIKTFMEPMLNDLGRNGFPLPIIGSVHFANTELHVQQNSLLIATDVKYLYY